MEDTTIDPALKRASVPAIVTRYFLGFRARAFSMAFVCFGLATVAPAGLKGFAAFLQSPPGVSVVALALVAIGCSVEETGTIRRIRIGMALRLLGAAVLAMGVVWAWFLGAPTVGLAQFGFVVGAMGAMGVAIAVRHDMAALSDVRHGQSVQLKELSAKALHIDINGAEVIVPATEILGVSMASNLDGRAVFVLVSEQARSKGKLEALPWIGARPDGDAFVLTEHQVGMDAPQFVRRVVEVAGVAQRGFVE